MAWARTGPAAGTMAANSVGAKTAYETGGGQIIVDQPRECDEEPVSGGAAVGGIDGVETVEIKNQKRRLLAVRQSGSEKRRPGALEREPIAESREDVVELAPKHRRFVGFEDLRPQREAAATQPPRRHEAGGDQQERRGDHQREGIEDHSRYESETRPDRIVAGPG